MTIVRELQTRDALGLLSWQDIVHLLGLLPNAPCDEGSDDDDAASFHTDTRTMSSMAYFRDPTGVRVGISKSARDLFILIISLLCFQHGAFHD